MEEACSEIESSPKTSRARKFLADRNHQTGLFISKALHPYNVFTEAGFEVDLSSANEKYYVDWLSETPDFLGAIKPSGTTSTQSSGKNWLTCQRLKILILPRCV